MTAEYIVSLLSALGATYLVANKNPTLSPVISYVLIPIAVAYTTLYLAHLAFPKLNQSGARVATYVESKTLGTINDMKYIQIFPPIFAITIIVGCLLYAGQFKNNK